MSMEKELIERLTREARFPQPPTQEHMAVFATLVAEECARIVETVPVETFATMANVAQSKAQRATTAAAIRKALKAEA